jgi:hypothetical protein
MGRNTTPLHSEYVPAGDGGNQKEGGGGVMKGWCGRVAGDDVCENALNMASAGVFGGQPDMAT